MRLITDIIAAPDHVLIRCKGRLICDEDIESVSRNVLAMQPHPTVVLVDLSQVESIRDADLGVLWLRFMEAQARGWKVGLIRVPQHLRSILNCGLDQMLPAFKSESVAISALQAQAAKGLRQVAS